MIQIGAVGGEIWRIGSEKWGSRRGQLDIFANTGNHTQFTFQKYPHWGPPLTPSGIIRSYY